MLALVLARSRPNLVSSRSPSCTPRNSTSELSLNSSTSSLVSGGTMIRNACGMTMLIIARLLDMPSDRAASRWPVGTAWMPARTVSAM